jgi:hypothetical protein
MRFKPTFALWIALVSLPLAAQNQVTIDLSQRPEPFSQRDYSELVACTLREHPSETRRYAEYHLLRRDIQSVEENEADPDSRLLMDAFKGCYEFQNGKPIPFLLDRVIGDWATYHQISSGRITNVLELATCAASNQRSFASAYLQFADGSSPKDERHRRMMLNAITIPPCSLAAGVQIDTAEFTKALRKVMGAKR